MAIAEIETYINLLSAGICDDSAQGTYINSLSNYQSQVTGENGPLCDHTFLSTFMPLDTADYDGTCTFSFDVVWKNKSEVSTGYIYLVDENNNIIATHTCLPDHQGPMSKSIYGSGSRNHYGNNFYRTSVAFTPLSGAHHYGLRVAIPSGFQYGWWATESLLKVDAATIVIHQVSPTKSGVHIPLMSDINSSTMSYDTPIAAEGQNVVTDGREAAFADVSMAGDYTANDRADEYFWDQIRSIWKYESSMLSPVSRVVFDASLGYKSPSQSAKSQSMFGTPNFSWCNYELRWCVNANGVENIGGTMGDATRVGVNTSDIYTLVGNSEFTWDEATDGHSWTAKVTVDAASLQNAVGSYLYFCGNENVMGGSGPSGPDHTWGTVGNFTLTIPAGTVISSAWLKLAIYPDEVGGDDVLHAQIFYEVALTGFNNGFACLWDLTADAMVAGSELEWDTYTKWERRSVTLSASALTDGHEYQMRVRRASTIAASYYNRPNFADGNLWVYVSGMTEFSSWNRILLGNVHDSVYTQYVYDEWGNIPPGNGSSYGGVININSRAKLFKPTGSEVFFEASSIIWSLFADWYPDDLGDTADWFRLSVYDVGTTDDMCVPLTTGEVTQSALTCTLGLADGKVHRQRSADIAAFVTNQNRYVNYAPEHDSYTGQFELTGYLITHYPQGSSGPVDDLNNWDDDLDVLLYSLSNHHTLVYAKDLMEGRHGWFYDSYAPGVLIHYGEEGSTTHSILCGGENGGVYQLTGETDNSLPIPCQIITASKDQGDTRYQKLYGDVMLDCDTQGIPVNTTPMFNGDNILAPTVVVNTPSRAQISVPVGVDWQMARNISLNLAWNATAGHQYFYIWEPRYTEEGGKVFAYDWETCFLTHDLPGYFYHGYLYIGHISNANMTFTITDEDETVKASVTVLSSGGLYHKDFLRLPVVKGKMFKYRIESTSQFRIEGQESELLVKAWGQGGPWKRERIFQDTPHGEAA